MENTAIRLKKAMQIRGIKQSELSRATGISKTAISNYLSGIRLPKQDKLILLGRALLVNETWLMGIDVPMDRQVQDSVFLDNFNSLTPEQQDIIKNMINQFILLNRNNQ